MNYVLYSRQRKSEIVDIIEQGSAFTRYQIQQLFFRNHKDGGKRKAQLTLTELVEKDKVLKRYYRDKFLPAVYYLEKKPQYLQHTLNINDIYCAFMIQKKSYQTVEWQWHYSIYNNMVISDAMISIWLEPDRKRKVVVWLECERDPRKRFDKDSQYEKVYYQDWNKEPYPEWVVVDNENKKVIFPTILIVTDHPPEINSKSNLRFIVASPQQVQENIFKLIWR